MKPIFLNFLRYIIHKEYLTFSHIQKFCSRRTWKYLGKHTEKLNKCRYKYWNELSNFFFCCSVFKSCLLQRCQKASICGEDSSSMSNCTILRRVWGNWFLAITQLINYIKYMNGVWMTSHPTFWMKWNYISMISNHISLTSNYHFRYHIGFVGSFFCAWQYACTCAWKCAGIWWNDIYVNK